MQDSPKADRVLFLDGLRGWGSIMVFFSHIFIGYLGSVTPAYVRFYEWAPIDGQLGVYIFFIVSGFALSIGYLRSNEPRVLAVLAIRRYPRLTIPILGSTILVYAFMKAGLMYNLPAGALLHSALALDMYNFTPSMGSLLSYALHDVYFNFDVTTQYQRILWTMPVEFFGSLLIFLTLFVRHFMTKRRLLCIGVLAVLCMQKHILLTFVLGILLADFYETGVLQRFRRSRYSLVLSCCLLVLGGVASVHWHVLYSQASPFFGAAIALSIVASVVLNAHIAAFFENGLSRFLGRISFPLFVTHSMVLASVTSYAYLYMRNRGVADSLALSNGIAAISIVAGLLVATLFAPVDRLAVWAGRKLSGRLVSRT